MKDLVALVLAGGVGKRFWPISKDKLQVPFNSKPVSWYTFERSIPEAVSRLVVVTNDINDEYYKNVKFSVPHTTVIQKNPRGMSDAILSASELIKDCRLLIIIADDLADTSLLQSVVDAAGKSDAFAFLPGLKVSTYFPGGYLELDGKRIQGIQEKPQPGSEPSEYVTISGHFFSDSSILLEELSHIQENSSDDQYERTLASLMKTHVFEFVPYSGTFLSLKYPWHILSFMDSVLESLTEYRDESVTIKSNVFIEGPVWIGKNVKIFENTKIVGPCVIGDNTIIGNNNVIRHSIIGADCVTGFNTDITRSYIGNSCWFHSNYIGDSILEENVSMGSGTVLANLRLDESEISSTVKETKMNSQRNKLGAIIGKQVRIGVNTSIMPGVKIGKDSFIGAGITVSQDIPDESFVYGKSELVVTKNTKKVAKDREEFKQKI